MSDTATLPELTREHREGFIETLEGLAPDQWLVPSLCSEWRVLDVAAHLAWAPVLGAGAGAVAMARHGFSMNRMIARSAVAWSARGRDAILQQLRDNARTGARPIGMPPVAALADAVVHGLDVRRPLGLPGRVPSEVTGPLGRLLPRHAVADERRGRRQRPTTGLRRTPGGHGPGLDPRRRTRAARLRRGTAASPLRSRPEGGRAGRARRRHGAGPPLTCSPAVAVAWADDARHTTAMGRSPVARRHPAALTADSLAARATSIRPPTVGKEMRAVVWISAELPDQRGPELHCVHATR